MAEVPVVVIPVFNNATVVGAQLDAVLAQEVEGDLEVVVADNGSSDASREVVLSYARRDPRVRLVDASARRGPGAARNIGAAAAVGEEIFFCDGDDAVHPGWLAGLREGLVDADIAVGALDVSTLGWSKPAPPLDPWPRQFAYLPAGLGANMAVRRAAFEAVGGFDEALLIGEDLDLCWRMQLSGYRLERRMDAVVAKRARPGYDIFRQALCYGRSDPVLFRRFHAHGMPRRVRHTVKVWAWLLIHAYELARPDCRRNWLRVASIQVGRLVGSAEQRVFYP